MPCPVWLVRCVPLVWPRPPTQRARPDPNPPNGLLPWPLALKLEEPPWPKVLPWAALLCPMGEPGPPFGPLGPVPVFPISPSGILVPESSGLPVGGRPVVPGPCVSGVPSSEVPAFTMWTGSGRATGSLNPA